mgnify:CR=1 FL=1
MLVEWAGDKEFAVRHTMDTLHRKGKDKVDRAIRVSIDQRGLSPRYSPDTPYLDVPIEEYEEQDVTVSA